MPQGSELNMATMTTSMKKHLYPRVSGLRTELYWRFPRFTKPIQHKKNIEIPIIKMTLSRLIFHNWNAYTIYLYWIVPQNWVMPVPADSPAPVLTTNLHIYYSDVLVGAMAYQIISVSWRWNPQCRGALSQCHEVAGGRARFWTW